MLHSLWEGASLNYIIISTILTLACLALTYFWNTKALNKQSLDTAHETTILKVKSLSSRKPLELAKELEEKLPQEVKLLEKKVENEQLEAIYKLMQKHSDQFGGTTMDDMKNQMQLYGF